MAFTFPSVSELGMLQIRLRTAADDPVVRSMGRPGEWLSDDLNMAADIVCEEIRIILKEAET